MSKHKDSKANIQKSDLEKSMDKRLTIPTLQVPGRASRRSSMSGRRSSFDARAFKAKLAAKNRWNILRTQVNQGFFKVVQKESVDVSDFATAVESLWRDVHHYSGIICLAETDTTVDFLNGVGVVKTINLPQNRRKLRRAGIDELSFNFKSNKPVVVVEANQEETFDTLQRQWGLNGLSFDSIPNCDVNDNMFAISKGLKKREIDEKTELSAVKFQILQNRGWKILLIGLTQAEPFARYEAMVDLGRSLPNIVDTLNDQHTRNEIGDVLINCTVSDERAENRIKALYLLGQFSLVLGHLSECHPMLSKIFKHLARLLLNIQAMKTELSPKADTRLHLIRAIAKFANFKISNNNQVEHLVVLMAYKELMKITEEKRELNSLNPNLFVLLSILDLLNSNVEITDLSKSYIGALFQKSIYPMLHSPHAELKRSAIQFISNWLPIQNEDALLVGYDNLIDGIKYSRIIGYQNFNENDFNMELRNLQEKIHLEECRVSLREKIIRSIIQPPGTVAHLLPVPGCTGFFCDSSSGMRKTKSILVDLPVHGKSNVTLTRLIPQIPGVPSCVTTTPPLYMVGEKWSESRPPPDSQYEYCERIGAIPSLPPLFTYNPNSQNITRDSKKPETPPNTLVVARNPTKWKEVDDLPKGTSRIPIRNDTELESASGSAPVGFNIICPYPGFDPDKIDRTVSYISAIYGKPIQWKSSNQNNQRAVLSQSADKYFYQDYSCVGTLEETPKLQSIDEGATFNRHPSLFPCKLHGLKSGESSTDFPIGAPVLFDILQPQSPKLHRILTIVENVESEASNIVVQKGANDIGGLYNGAIFNVYVRTREQPNKWIAIQLKVIDEDYDDGLDLGVANQTQPWKSKRESLAKREASFISSTTEIFSHPMPTQYTSTGEPYFPPPVTMPMYPVGYNDKRFPYFGKSPTIKPIPLGMTPKGSRYYSEKHKESTDSGFKNQIAGYDCDGQPFFIPRGFTLPSPSGYTIDGIPYYDVPTLIRQPGIMAFPTAFRDINRLPVDGDSWEDLVILLQKPSANAVMQKKSETALRTKLAKHLSDSQPVVFKKILSSHNRVMNPNQNKAGVVLNNNFTPPDDRSLVEDPENISEFLADGLAFSHLKPQPIRIVTEPAHCDFHSARAPTTKTIALRHKSGRGDHTEREFFVAVEPPNIFSIKEFNFKLQGEGVHEILVTFYPLSMKSSTCEGGLHVFDKYGRKMATSKLTAIKKKFFKVSPTQMDIGWVLPGRKKELSVVIENLAEYQINVSMILGSKPNSSENTAEVKKYSGFRLEFDTIKLRPLETSKIPIIFNPKLPGRALETCIFRGPGGEEVLIQLVGTTDIPLAIYPENEENSKLGITALSIERTQLIRKIDKAGTDDIAASGLSKFEANVMELITRSQTDTKKNAPVLDFGICVPENVQTTRILTVMNWGDEPITCSLYSYDKAVTCPYLVRIAPRSASSVEVVLTYNGIKHHIRGNYTSVLEIACKGFDNMSVSILAFIGQAVYLPIYEYAFFKPCRIGQSSSFQTHIMNESQYDIKGAITGLEEVDGVISDIQCSPGFEKGETTFVVPAYSLIPVNFYYKPQFSGPSIKRIQIQIISPGSSLVNATMKGAELFLIGSCIQPKSDSSKGKVTPIVEKLIQWVSNLRNIKGGVTEDGWVDPDASNPISISADDLYEVVFKVDPFVPEIPGDFGSSSQVLSVQNRGSVTRKVKFFASAGFTVDPKGKELEPGELLKLDYFFNPPPNIGTMVTVFGFAAALDQMNGLFSATQLVKRLSLGLLLLPFQCYIDQQIVLDFGRVEITSECNSDCTRYLILCNPFFVRYNWSIKVAPSARKTLAFEMPFTKGTLPKSETFAVPFRLKTDVSGTFETKCEVFLDPNDPYSKSIRLGTILLKGIAVFTQLTGLPESIDFGSTIVHHSTKKKLNLQNEGSQEMEVNVLLRAPFSISPPKFTIPAKSNQVVEVSFNPTEHRLASTIMQIFANQNLYCVKVSGVGGTALLVCEDYSEKPLDFGLHQDGLIVSTNIQFFNKGSIPLKLKAVVSDNPSRIRVEFLGITNSSSHEAPKFDIRKDYWRTVRRKIKVFRFLFSNQKPIPSKKYGSRANTVQRDPIRKYIPVEDVLEVDPVTSSVQVPDLPALSSYNFRISYIITYHTSNLQSELSLTYVPICDESESVAVENLLESTTIELLASAFVPLDIHPSTLSFGYCPTETGAISKISQTDNANNYGVTSLTSNNNFVSYLPIKVSNPGNNVQNLILDTISPEFFIQGKTWAIAPKEVIEIPVEFHPSREQTHYIGEAKFTHKYGSVSVVLNGVGASAEIVADEILDFGNLKLDTKLSKNLTIHNRGILDCSYEIEIIQSSSTFYLVDEEDPYESYGNVKSGLSVIKRIECLSKKKDGMEGHICIRWKKVPNGVQEKTIVPLRVSTGYPDFKMQLTELDFKVVYLDINRTIDFKISNNGNAVCNWKGICDHPTLSLNVDEGIIESGETIILKITFKPVEYEILDSSITFQTDSGTIKLICFGVVGVPFLKIFRDSRDIDFGVVTVGQQHHTFVDIANTGAVPIDYEIQWIYMSKNQKPCKLHEFDFFFVEPNSGRILPNDILSLKVSLLPKEYATVYQASFIIRTKAGEEHTVKIRGVGGQAIIKIKPPTVTNNYARPIATPETDDKEVKRNFQRSKDESETGSRIPNLPTKSFEANRHLFKAHVNNLHEILAGLRAAEMEISPEQVDETPNPTRRRYQLEKREDVADIPESTKFFMEYLNEMEKELDEAIGKLDPTGAYSLDLSSSRPRSTITPDTSTPLNPTPPSQKSSRSFGSYNPGHRMHRSSRGTQSLVTTPREKSSSKTPDEHIDDLSQKRADYDKTSRGSRVSSRQYQIMEDTMELDEFTTNTKNAGASKSPSKADQDSTRKREKKSRHLSEKTTQHRNSTMVIRESSGVDLVEDVIEDSSNVNLDVPYVDESISASKLDSTQRIDMDGKDKSTQQIDIDVKEIQVGEDIQGSKSMLIDSLNPNEALNEVNDENLSESFKSMVLFDVKEQKTEVERIIEIGQKLGLTLEMAEGDMYQIKQLNQMVSNFMVSTRSTIRTVKEQLIHETWVPNRELLQQALRKLEMSAVAIQDMFIDNQKDSGKSIEDECPTYPLSLISGGERTNSTLLFNLPNEGNINFEYEIVPNYLNFLVPEDVMGEKYEFFVIENSSGILGPGQNVNVSATFSATITGKYRQGFIVKSGEEEIAKFQVSCAVGNPKLTLSVQTIDFGLVAKSKVVEKMFSIENRGSYEGSWILEVVGNSDSDSGSFILSATSGKTDPNEKTIVSIAFKPNRDGQFFGTIRLVWKDGPNILTLQGSGGIAKLDFLYHSVEDRDFNGLDFGTCLVNSVKEKRVTVKNIGQMGTELEIGHPNKFFTFEIPRDSNGEIHIGPGDSFDLIIFYKPEAVEKLKDFITFILGVPRVGSQNIPTKGIAGTQNWTFSGELDFKNKPFGTTQTRTLKVTNSGTLDLPLEISWLPPKASLNFEVQLQDWDVGKPLVAGKSAKISITATGKMAGEISGSFRCEYSKSQFKDYPYFFHCFTEEIALDNNQDVSLGRVAVGEFAQASRKITNFSDKVIHYRAKITNQDGREELLDWRIDGDTGTLLPNESVIINAIFEAAKGRGEDWQNAQLVIEKKLDEDKNDNWTVFSTISLQGAVGTPHFSVNPMDLDFKVIKTGRFNTIDVSFTNDGSAPCVYEILPWEGEDEFSIINLNDMKGMVAVNQSLSFQVKFFSELSGEFSTKITVLTAVGPFTLNAFGEAYPIQLFTEKLPEIIHFDRMNLGDSQLYELVVENDCILDVELTSVMTTSGGNGLLEYMKCYPAKGLLGANMRNSEERSELRISLEGNVSIPKDNDGVPDQTFMQSFPLNRELKYTLKVYNIEELLFQIPVQISFFVSPITVVPKATESHELPNTPTLTAIDLGCFVQEVGGSRKYIVYNDNSFAVRYSIELKDPSNRFAINERVLEVIPGGEYSDFTLTILPKVEIQEGISSETFNGEIVLITSPAVMENVVIPISGTLADNSDEIELPEEIYFGPIFKQKRALEKFSFTNTSKKKLTWEIAVEEKYADIFRVLDKSSDVTPPLCTSTVTISFCPQIAVKYEATAYFKSSKRNHAIMLIGEAAEPALEVTVEETNFGVIGLSEPEFREVELFNPTQLNLRIRPRSNNPNFYSLESEIELAAGERKNIKVIFVPSTGNTPETGNMTFYQLGDLQEGQDVEEEILIEEQVMISRRTGNTPRSRERTPGSRPFSAREEVQALNQVTFQGVGGDFGFGMGGVDVGKDDVEPLNEETLQILGNNVEISNIQIKFNKVSTKVKVRKVFEIENTGDTYLDLVVYKSDNTEMADYIPNSTAQGFLRYTVSPCSCKVPPKKKENLFILVEGLSDGSDYFDFFVKTKNLMVNKIVRVRCTATVFTSKEFEKIQSFSRADETIETFLDAKEQEERYARTDQHLWKVLLPICRVSVKLPSEEFAWIAPVEPNVNRIEIGPFVVRPPAIPDNLPPKGKKWYTNRISMAVDKYKSENHGNHIAEARKDEAAAFIGKSNMEKFINLEKKRSN